MADSTLRIASYNIRKARGLDNRRMPERTLQVINQLDADIIVVQEADKRLGERHPALPRALIEAETDLSLLEVADNGPSLGWHGNAILIRPSFKVSEVERLTLPGFEPRGAVAITVDIGAGVRVFATHLGLMRRDRRDQLDMLQKATRHGEHTIIAGDFNEWSKRRGLEPLEDSFRVHAPGRSFHARRPIAALDRVALSHDIKMRDAGVEEGALARRASDHLPVWADIAVPANAPTC